MKAVLRPLRGTKSNAESKLSGSSVLQKGEVFFEIPDTGEGSGNGKIKMGDGSTDYANLPYFSGDGSTIVKSDSAPTDTNKIWIDTGNSGVLKYYDGSSWVPCASVWG